MGPTSISAIMKDGRHSMQLQRAVTFRLQSKICLCEYNRRGLKKAECNACEFQFCRVLLEHGANVVALNNDCSIPLDICKSEEIREIFIQDINAKGLY